MNRLSGILTQSTAKFPERCALQQIDGQSVTYSELAYRVQAIAAFLQKHGLHPGSRIGILVPKSITSVTAILATLHVEAVYIPADAAAPATRNAYIFADGQVQAILAADHLIADISEALSANVRAVPVPDTDLHLLHCRWQSQSVTASHEELAYLLYTSGSTGKPKGVMISHQNALSFVDWCLETFPLSEADVFSSIAPLHFDLSIFDLFCGLKAGGSIVLFDQKAAKNPLLIASLMEEHRISVLYATPTLLRLLLSYGRMDQYEHADLRIVHFAGEVFPVEPLRQLQQRWSQVQFYNLYGPTETNVVTWHPIPVDIPADRTAPYPIGQSCSHVECRLWDDGFPEHRPGLEAELVVSGASVALGYRNLPERTAAAFFTDTDGRRWYHTGDIVRLDDDHNFVFVGRRDRMVKRRGYRIELGEIEAALSHHPAVREAGVIPRQNEENELRIVAYLSQAPDSEAPNAFALKQFLQQYIPQYMLPDRFIFLENLPQTSTQKIDYQSLKKRTDD